MGTLNGKVAAITGGTRGIGRGIAAGFLAASANVVINGRDAAKGAATLKEMDAGARLHFHPGDASVQQDVEGFVDGVVDLFGQLDVLVLNAGAPCPDRLVDVTDDDYEYEVRLNLSQFFYGIRRALTYMLPRRSGRILCVSSTEGKLGKPYLAVYSACKHGVIGLAKSVAHEVGSSGITVNVLCPGPVQTDAVMTVGPRLLEVQGITDPEQVFAQWLQNSATQRPSSIEEIAGLATFLAGDLASGITGSTFNIDGGISPY